MSISSVFLTNYKNCPICNAVNKEKANFCDQCRYEFWRVEHRDISDLTKKEKNDISEFYKKKKSNKRAKNIKELIKDLNN